MRLRLLFLADSHLGFDMPGRPRVRRRRRGPDFQANYERALAPALQGGADVVVHGGDVFHRPRVPVSVAHAALTLLVRVAERGVPVFVVPGNHERSRIPHARFAMHPGIHIFDRPATHAVDVGGIRVAVAGFPFERRDIRSRFREVLERTGWRDAAADVRLLVMHQCVEGARVGPADFTFTNAPDVVRGGDIPADFAAVLCGHIHRHQVLRKDLGGVPLATPVLYPGSVERTSLAERDERKGFMTADITTGRAGGRMVEWQFHELPARPMLVREIAAGPGPHGFERRLRTLLDGVPPDAVLRIRVTGTVPPRVRRLLAAERLRALAPPTMNIDVQLAEEPRFAAREERPRRTRPHASILELPF